MRILTVRQPWADAILLRGKTVENRSRNIAGDYRGPVLIHAAAKLPPVDEFNEASRQIGAITGFRPLMVFPHRRGVILGVVDLVGVHNATECADLGRLIAGEEPRCSPWADDAWHLVFENPRILVEPIPWKGGLGLRKTDMDVVGDWLVEPLDQPHEPCTPGCEGEPWCEIQPVARLNAVTF
jgi:hypothetical protein